MKPHEIETARLRLRPLAKADVDELHALWSSHEVRGYLWDNEVIARQWTASLVGFGGFWYLHTPPKLELLCGIEQEHWNRGLATEIVQTLVRYGFEELEFSEVWASTDAPNVASASVLEKAGLQLERRAAGDGLETLFYCLPRSAFQPVATGSKPPRWYSHSS